MATRDELVVAIARRYASSNRQDRSRILDDFMAVSGFIASTRCVCFALGYPAAGQAPGLRGAYTVTRSAKR